MENSGEDQKGKYNIPHKGVKDGDLAYNDCEVFFLFLFVLFFSGTAA
jgi:hypothetical protein